MSQAVLALRKNQRTMFADDELTDLASQVYIVPDYKGASMPPSTA